MGLHEAVACIKDAVVALSALGTVTVAVYGVTQWKNEIKGKERFEAAKRLMRAAYKLRDRMQEARNPFIPVGEFPDQSAYSTGASPQERAKGLAHVYEQRWWRVAEVLSELDEATFEAEVLWGEDIKVKAERLKDCARRLYAAFKTNITLVAQSSSSGSDNDLQDEIRKIVSWGSEKPDKFEEEVKEKIGDIEKTLRPFLEINSP